MLDLPPGTVRAQVSRGLDELRERANRGDRRARYLRGVAREIVQSGYDPRKTKFLRHRDGSFEWVYPDGSEDRGGHAGGT